MPTSENTKILQELEDICGNKRITTHMSVESIPWYAYEGLNDYERTVLQDEQEQSGIPTEYKAATIIGEFLGQYEKIFNLYNEGVIDADMFKCWKKKYYERLENAEKASDDKMK